MKKIIIVTLVGAILLSGCGMNNQSSSPAKIDKNASKENTTTPATSTPNTLLSETSDKKIAIYGVQDKAQKDMFSSLDVVINGETKTFNWINVTNPSFYPQISVVDLNADGKDEIVIVLTKGTGTGVHDSEVHVLKSDFTEISVSDPRKFVLSNIKVDLKTDKGIRKYTLSVDGQEHLFEFSESDSNDWFEQPTVQNILKFGIKDNQLIAELPIQISTGNYLGDAIVRFAFVNGKLEPSKIEITKEGSSL
ncbi:MULTISPECIES: hypothetical protein [Paenibacillus]|uniref:VCBS repeat-containing protein n=1 Tax=Paenibacillus pabuli TaxID=1472 RepID=A0A855XS82_9BACL|nr:MULTISPECIES: hypothetical protein [Paenibacillus]PWW38089.1 hypothetical protein DET56_108282 [Paenibacillus pabuli]PXW08316.1 hypothetical protein DEU73_104282 [Paenibacillus taichungensis]RAI94467.1 hypothetical protein DET54_108267 [Paenibacillus pabuli]